MFRCAHPVSHTTSGRRGQLVPYVAFGIVALGVVNFLWFMTETLPLNLIPSDHRIIDGHYYLWSNLHGGLVEVGQQAYRWLPVHEAILFLSWPLVMLAGGTLVFRHLAGRIAGSSAVDSAGNVIELDVAVRVSMLIDLLAFDKRCTRDPEERIAVKAVQ